MSVFLAFTFARRHWIVTLAYALFASFLILCLSLLHELHEQELRQLAQIWNFQGAIISPKQNSLSTVEQALHLTQPPKKVLPYNLFKTLSEGASVRFEDHAAAEPIRNIELAPLLYLGEWSGHRVFATNPKLLKFLGASEDLLCRDCVVSNTPVHFRKLSELTNTNSLIQFTETTFEQQKTLPLTGHAWDQVILVSIDKIRPTLTPTQKSQSNIWGAEVLSFIFLNGPAEELRKVESLINDRSVAQFTNLQDQWEILKSLSGRSPERDRIFVGLIVALAVMSLLFATYFVRSQWRRLSVVMDRIGYSRTTLWQSVLIYSLLILILATLSSAFLLSQLQSNLLV